MILELRDLTKVFSGRQPTIRAVDGVRWRSPKGPFGLVGESGSGKSTLAD
jgi:ABC-type oligopeptide transport system ATPase subunit